jgi:hypothetical protein
MTTLLRPMPRPLPPPRLWVNADGSTSAVGCATAEVPADHGLVLELAARCLAIALVRGYAGARELSDLLAAARVRLPLLNWPTSALQPLHLVAR